MANNREQRFFNALRDVFVGAEVEGESGFVNLMRIKARYYEKGVFPRLKEDIDPRPTSMSMKRSTPMIGTWFSFGRPTCFTT